MLLKRMRGGLRSSTTEKLWQWETSRVSERWRIRRVMRDWRMCFYNCPRKGARSRPDTERPRPTWNHRHSHAILGQRTIHKSDDSRPSHRRIFFDYFYSLRQLHLSLLLQQTRLIDRSVGSGSKPPPRLVSRRFDPERFQWERAPCERKRCRLRVYLPSSAARGFRGQGPVELAHHCSVRVSPAHRVILAIFCVLPHFMVCRCLGRTRDPRLSRNRTLAQRGHHTLTRVWAGREEEDVEEPLHCSRHGC